MLPIILETNNELEREKFIEKFTAEHAVTSYNRFTYVPEGKEFSIKQIREITAESSYNAKENRLFHLLQFDTASLEAQNAFLKTLEEHPPNLFYILSVENSNHLLLTIKSRSRLVKLDRSLSKKNMGQYIDKLIDGELRAMFDLAAKNSLKTDHAALFDSLIKYFRDRLTSDPKAPQILKEIISQRAMVNHNHLDPQSAMDTVLITIYKAYDKK